MCSNKNVGTNLTKIPKSKKLKQMFQIWSICHLTSGICATNLGNSDPRYLGPIKMCFLCINFDRELSKQPLYQGLFNYSCFEASVKSTLKYFWHFTELSKAMGMCPQNATVQTVKVFPWTLVLDMSPGTVWWKVLHLYIFQLFVHYFISSDSLHLQFSPCCIACPRHNQALTGSGFSGSGRVG